MHTIEYPTTAKWVVAHNGNDIFHFSLVEPQNSFSTGQPFMDIFDSKEELLTTFPNLSSVVG
jgi:hypothetical protein